MNERATHRNGKRRGWSRAKRLAVLSGFSLLLISVVALIGLKAGNARAAGRHLGNGGLAGALAGAGWLVVVVLYRLAPRVERTERPRAGQVLIVFVVAMVVVAAVGALAVDVGFMFAAQARMQNASDAAALAAVQTLVSQRADGQDEQTARDEAREEGVAIANANCAGASVEIQFGRFGQDSSFEEFGYGQDDEPATAVRAIVTRDQNAPDGALGLFFSPLLGMESADVSARAVGSADSNIRGINVDLSPFTVHRDELPEPGQELIVYDHDDESPGCFGLLNFDGGPFTTPEVREWIRNGYDEEFVLAADSGHLWVYGGTGFRAAIKDALQEKLGEEITVCVHDRVEGQGHNTEFRVVSFARVTVTDFRLTGKGKGQDRYVKGRLEAPANLQHVRTGNAEASANIRTVRLRQ